MMYLHPNCDGSGGVTTTSQATCCKGDKSCEAN